MSEYPPVEEKPFRNFQFPINLEPEFKLTLEEAKALYSILEHEWISPIHPSNRVISRLVKFIYVEENKK